MPTIGLGTWKSPRGSVGEAVTSAITKYGYRHIDCAPIYHNEKEIGASLPKVFGEKGIPREDVFVTSKLWNGGHRKDAVRAACEATLQDLGLGYLDLYLMHWGVATPADEEVLDADGVLIEEKVPIRETWEAMEALVRNGLVRAIGVANFTAPMLIDLLSYAETPPAVNQIELHPYLQQSKLVKFCQSRDMVVTAYSPLGSPGNFKGRVSPLDDETIKEIAARHKKTPAQVLIRWAIQRGTIAIPKSVTPERIGENISVFDFKLSESDMELISGLERGLRFVDPYEWWGIPYFD